MKLYAIRDKKTGQFETDIYGNVPAYIYKPYLHEPEEDELVILRVEPNEPCEVCIDPELLLMGTGQLFCDRCGRSLT